ncbi:MAG: hypothetical protein U9N87_10085 [Planctomycetota bacterium]|nr:hypothetical protein [Planctomycetota bacterium]
MQSTTTIVCRAFVMIVCLITIPLAALFGTSLPDLIQTLGWGESSVSAREQGGMAPAYSPNIPDVAGLPDASGPRLSVADGLRCETLPLVSDASRVPEDPRTVPASYIEPAAASVSFENASIPINSRQMATVPVVRQPAEVRFEQIHKRLWRLGATFKLESFGTSRQFYRFQCEMPLGGQSVGGGSAAGVPTAVQHFESTSENSLQAMETVLAEIEAWLRPR